MRPEDVAAERREGIAKTVEAYYAAESGNPIPGKENVEMPEPLEHLLRYERWDCLPRSGGLYDQPYHYMADLEAAMLGRERYREVQRINQERQANGNNQ